MGHITNEEESAASEQDKKIANTEPSMESDNEAKSSEFIEAAKEQGDDGDEMVVEGEEDTVIY